MPMPADDSAGDLAACRTLLRTGSRSFHTASLLLPRGVREPASVLYAFCRLADDAIDLEGNTNALTRLRDRLDRAYAGQPLPIPADRALAVVVARHGIPRALPDALLEGFAWDQSGRSYETISEVRDYAARVAGSVGAIMAVIMDARAPEVVARACDLGVAMQLSNIARDVGEDARAGRLYLPRDWLREAGIDPEAWLARPVAGPALAGVVRRLLAEADTLYLRAETGIARLPLACRPGIGAARHIYAEIGRAVERAGCDSVTHRAVVPGSRKLALLGRSLTALAVPAASAAAPPLAETRFLVQAVQASAPLPLRVLARNLDDRVAWLVDLFVRLERREQAARGARTA